MSSLGSILLLGGAFALLFAIAELLYHFANIPAELTRKLVHVGTGCLTLLFPIILYSSLQVGILCSSFLLILIMSRGLKLLPSINAVGRDTLGSLLYPVIVFLVFLYYRYKTGIPTNIAATLYYFYAPVLVMALCDPIAALAGTAWRRIRPDTAPGKTMAGSFAFFGVAAILAALLAANHYRTGIPIQAAILTGILIAFLTTLAERFSGRGWDNFTIPLAVIICIEALEIGLKSFVR
jgi:phytol kinase